MTFAHFERFRDLGMKRGFVFASNIDREYGAAFYILSCTPELARVSMKYVTGIGIDFPKMLRKERFGSSTRILVNAAWNLFNGAGGRSLTPLVFCRDIDRDMFEVIITAMRIRRYGLDFVNIEGVDDCE